MKQKQVQFFYFIQRKHTERQSKTHRQVLFIESKYKPGYVMLPRSPSEKVKNHKQANFSSKVNIHWNPPKTRSLEVISLALMKCLLSTTYLLSSITLSSNNLSSITLSNTTSLSTSLSNITLSNITSSSTSYQALLHQVSLIWYM